MPTRKSQVKMPSTNAVTALRESFGCDSRIARGTSAATIAASAVSPSNQ